MIGEASADARLDGGLGDFIHQWAAAIVANDVTLMEQFVTEDWLIVDRPGVGTRAQFHAVVASGDLRHDSMTHEVVETRRLTPDVALLVTRGRNTGSYRGQPISADEWTTDVLVRTSDGWRCALTHLTPVQPMSEA